MSAPHDDLNGLTIGDVIYNEHRKGMFLITLFVFERIITNPTEEHPYILGRSITLDDKGVTFGTEDVHVSIHGSSKVTASRVVEMIHEQVEIYRDKVVALNKLLEMVV